MRQMYSFIFLFLCPEKRHSVLIVSSRIWVDLPNYHSLLTVIFFDLSNAVGKNFKVSYIICELLSSTKRKTSWLTDCTADRFLRVLRISLATSLNWLFLLCILTLNFAISKGNEQLKLVLSALQEALIFTSFLPVQYNKYSPSNQPNFKLLITQTFLGRTFNDPAIWCWFFPILTMLLS